MFIPEYIDELEDLEEFDDLESCICPVCGKSFIPAPYHVYKHVFKKYKEPQLVCTWSCLCEARRNEEEKENISKLEKIAKIAEVTV